MSERIETSRPDQPPGHMPAGTQEPTALAPCPTPIGPSRPISPERLASDYLARLKGRPSEPSAAVVFRQHLLPALAALGVVDCRALTPPLCRQAVAVEVPRAAAERGRQLAPKSLWNVWAVLRAALAWQIELGQVEEPNPARGMRHGYHIERVDHAWRDGAYLQLGQAQMLWQSAELSPTHRHLWACAIMLGTRHGELAALRVRDVNFDMTPLPGIRIDKRYDSQAKIIRRGTKTSRHRVIPVPPTLVVLIRRFLEPGGGFEQTFGRKPRPDDPLVPCAPPSGHDRPPARWSANTARKTLLRDLDLLGLPRVRLHDLRRTWRTIARASGVSRETRDICTHAPPSDVRSLYESVVWTSICEEIVKIPWGAAVQLPLRLAG